MDTGDTPYGELWGRIVEESLANWVAVKQFTGREARLLQKLIESEPAEYQCYAYLGEALPMVLPMDWRYLWREWRHGWHRWYHEWEEFLEWVRRHDFPIQEAFFRQLHSVDELEESHKNLSSLVYRVWRAAKKEGIVEDFWKLYADYLLAITFS